MSKEKQTYKFEFLDIYEPVFKIPALIIDIWGGRGRGGSHFITDFALFKITQPHYFRGYFMREIKQQVRESLFRDFKDRIEENETIDDDEFKINESTMSIEHLPTGNTINCRGFKKSSLKHTAKQKSLAGATHVFIDEADEIEKHDFNQLIDSLRTKKSEIQVFRCFNSPQKDHWIIKDYYNVYPAKLFDPEDNEIDGFFEATPKKIEGFLSIFGTYLDNFKNINIETVKLWESYFYKNIEHYFSNVKGLVSGGEKGLIYKHAQKYRKLPDEDFYRLLGLDFGGTDPYALVEVNISKKLKRLYVREILYQTNVTNSELIQTIKDEIRNDECLADSARPDKIMELTLSGLNIFGAKKGADSILSGIDIVKEYELFIHEDSMNIWNEKNKYKRAINPDTKEPMNKPVDKNNHALDSIRYAATYYHLYINQ